MAGPWDSVMKRLVRGYAKQFARWLVAEEYDLLAISQVIGGLVFKTGPELEWFRKRFSMFQDILRESWVYQEIIEQGVEKGREEEREGRLQEQREMLMRLIQLRFPELEALAKQQSNDIMNPEILPPVNFKMLDAQTVEEARQLLLNINKGETKH
jgi:hypothetical protein